MQIKETASKKAKSRKRVVKNPKVSIIILLVIIILAGLLYYFRSQFIVATINGRPISRLTLINELENQAGKQVLESLITKTLILQEAKKQKVTVSDDEINEEIKKLEENFTSQGQDLNQLLEMQGMNRDKLREEIRMQKTVEKIAGRDINITDGEIDGYIEENKASIPKDLSDQEARTGVKQQLEQQKMNEKIKSWIQSLRDNAKINYLLKL